jgi:hypothetical protein
MRRIWIGLAIAAASISPVEAHAFERCDKLFASADELRTFVFEEGVRYAPKKYFDKARSIRIDIDQRTGHIIPFAKFDSDRQPVIVYPAAFPSILCRMVLATFLVLDGDTQPAAEAASTAGRCVLSGKPREICLKDQARDLERRYRAKFAALPAGKQQLAYGIVSDALGQIAKHEFAHHLLGHWNRIGSGSIARIDAEFEADFYAVLNGIQVGENPGAMYYFFDVLADMEAQSEAMRSPDYESGDCRARNINDITALFGAAPMMLVDFADGGAKFRNSTPKVELPKIARELAERGAPKPSAKSCGRLSEVVLREAHAELANLIAPMAEYAHLLPKRPGRKDGLDELALDGPEVFTLIERLEEQSRSLTHIKGLAARVLSILVSRVGLAGVEAKVSRQLDAVVESAADDILSSDYGRFLKVKALHVLYDTDGPAAARIDAAKILFESAVTFLPDASEGWMNLAMIAFAKGDCRKAAELADKAARTTNDKDAQGMAESFRNQMRGISNPKRCAEDGARFAETFVR